jgi:hypothetical protein
LDSRFAAAKIVIVHGRQIVVYERESVNQLNRDGGPVEQVRLDAETLACCVNEQGTNSLAPVEYGITHGSVEPLRSHRYLWQRRIQATVHALLVCRNAVLELVGQRNDPAFSSHVAYTETSRGARALLGYNSRPS